MNIDFNAAFDAGLSDEEIVNIMKRSLEEARKAEEEAKRQAQQKVNDKEALKEEGRASLMNAVVAYSEAFDLLKDGEGWTRERLEELEKEIIELEELLPLYVKLIEMRGFSLGDLLG